MIHIRTLDGSVEDMLDPVFRKISFEDEAAIIIVSTHLRHAWTALPAEDTQSDLQTALGSFMQANHARSEETRKAVPQNPNVNTVHTPWRDEVYRNWNHVFWDVSRFLGEVGCTGVHIHPPSHGVFAVDYESGAAGVRKVWETDILVIPAYLAPGVSVRLSRRVEGVDGESGEGEKMLGVFDGANVYDIWYVKRNTPVVIHIDVATERNGDVPAVMAYGVLCREAHGAEGDQEESD